MSRKATAGRGREEERGAARMRAVWAGSLLGVGAMASFDVILFHQILQWHHFYVDASEYWRIASDGFFHLLPLTLLVAASLVLLAAWRAVPALVRGERFWGSFLFAAGGFQLFDGTVNHLILRIHPVRENVASPLPYDLGWIGSALALTFMGWLVWRRAGRR